MVAAVDGYDTLGWVVVAVALLVVVAEAWGAVDRRLGSHTATVRLFGPFPPTSVVVLQVSDEMLDLRVAGGMFDALRRECPETTFLVTSEEVDLTVLNEDDMRDAGWVRR